MKSIKLTTSQLLKLKRSVPVAKSVACHPRGEYYSNRGVAIQHGIQHQ